MHSKPLFWNLAAFLLLSFPGIVGRSEATVITFDVAAIGGNTFEYRYVVENDTLGVAIEELAVYFDLGLFENLRMPTVPPDWDPVVVQPDPVLADDGFLDVLAISVGIPPGGSLGLFTVWADFLGAGIPGSQPFEILDPATFAVLDSGFTIPARGMVPEPGTWWLVALGLAALGLRSKVSAQETSR